MSKGIRVTVEDLETGDIEEAEIQDDFLLLCVGSCYLDGSQAYKNGTVVLTIKGRRYSPTPTTRRTTIGERAAFVVKGLET